MTKVAASRHSEPGFSLGVNVQRSELNSKIGLPFAAALALAVFAGSPSGVTPAAAIEPFTITDQPFWAISEVRGGILDHALEDSPTERGIAANLEVLGGRFAGEYGNSILDFFLTPRPYLGTTLAFGKTDEFYWGVAWDAKIFGPIFLEGDFGGAVHDGPVDTPGVPAYGCRVNFRESTSLGYELTPQWRVMAEIDHMSNGNLCHPNHGLTNAGLRLGYRF